MDTKQRHSRIERLRLISSSTKIWNQFMMFILIGLLPVFFPQWVYIENRTILTINVSFGLVTSFLFEVWKTRLEKIGESSEKVTKLQLWTSVILLMIFLHFFGRINGPFFVLYLLTIMESSLNLNVSRSQLIASTMIFSTIVEYIYLVMIGEKILGFISLMELMVRVLSITFMRSYGIALAQNIIDEQRASNEALKTARKLKKTTNKLQRANVRLKKLSSLKDEFVSVASHQLRTPMTAIKGYLWLTLNKEKGKISKKAKANLEKAYRSTERTIALVRDMLTISRIERKKLDFNPVKTDLFTIVEKVFDELKIEADEKKVKFKLERPKMKLWVMVDHEKIREVIQNLIDNALKFAPVSGRVEIFFNKDKGKAIFNVSDTGPGIPKNQQSKLFKKFGRLEHSFTQLAEKPGTGLGLYIAKQVIGLHKGEIWVTSKVGEGSTFSFSLPTIK